MLGTINDELGRMVPVLAGTLRPSQGIILTWAQQERGYPCEAIACHPAIVVFRLRSSSASKRSFASLLEQFLQLCQEVQLYGSVQLDPCRCDYPEPGCEAVLSVGRDKIHCCVTLPDNRTQDITFQMSRVKCWQVTFLVSILVPCFVTDLESRCSWRTELAPETSLMFKFLPEWKAVSPVKHHLMADAGTGPPPRTTGRPVFLLPKMGFSAA